MRLLFMGTPEFAVPHLMALAKTKHQLLGVVTRPDRPAGRGKKLLAPPVKQAAQELGLPVYQPATLKDDEFRETVTALAPDCICVVAYGAFLPQWILDLPPAECVNVHPSLLPKYRGAAPIQRALMNGDLETGLTTMYMSEAMDAGDLILQETLEIRSDDDSGTLHDRLSTLGARLLCQTIDLISEGSAPRLPQDDSLVTFAPKIEPNDEIIDWSNKSQVIDNQVRALRPRPGAYTYYQGRRVKIWRAIPGNANGPGGMEPGTVLSLDTEQLTVATGSGMLHVVEVQPENGKRLSAQAFANGYRIQVGDRLGS